MFDFSTFILEREEKLAEERNGLIPLMLIEDKSKYITHESSEKEWKAAANELGECLKKAMSDCYTSNNLTKEAYICSIQKYIGQAKHQITFEPNMEITLVDQYGREWKENESKKSLKSPVISNNGLIKNQSLFNLLGTNDNLMNKDRKKIPLDVFTDYYNQIQNSVKNPSIDILSLGKGPLSYEAARDYIESNPLYLNLRNYVNRPLILEKEKLSYVNRDEKISMIEKTRNNKDEEQGLVDGATYYRVTKTTINQKYNLIFGTDLINIAHVQKVTTSVAKGEEGKVIGAYLYVDINEENINNIVTQLGVGFSLFETLGFEFYVQNLGLGAKISVSNKKYSLFVNLDINLLGYASAIVGIVNKLKNGDEVEDSFEINGNLRLVMLAIAYLCFYSEMPETAQAIG